MFFIRHRGNLVGKHPGLLPSMACRFDRGLIAAREGRCAKKGISSRSTIGRFNEVEQFGLKAIAIAACFDNK